MTTRTFRVAAVQAAPVYYDLDASLDKASSLVSQAKTKGCELVAFGEAWLPGYPFHIWTGSMAWGMQFAVPYADNSLELGSPQFARLQAIARENGTMVSMGYSERAGGSLYLGQCLIDSDGHLLFARRKLKPTHVERTVFGEGYGDDLAVVDTAIGRIGALCCWEHIQPLSKYALYSQGEQIHIAGWPAFSVYRENAYALGQEVNMAASQIYAVEGGCFVIAATSLVNEACIERLGLAGDAKKLLTLGGGSAMIFAPDGRRLAEHLPEGEEGLVIADIDLDWITIAKTVADPAGHYAKPDATQLLLHRGSKRPVIHKIEEQNSEAVNLCETGNEEGEDAN